MIQWYYHDITSVFLGKSRISQAKINGIALFYEEQSCISAKK